MDPKKDIASALSERIQNKECEDIHWEYKNSMKFYNEIDKKFINNDEMAKILVAFSNREGGYLIIGIDDTLSFEGGKISDKFSHENKNGFDKFTEFVSNVIRDKVSPNIEVNIFHLLISNNEIIVIQIPQRLSIPIAVVDGRDSSRIKKRIYYVRTNHGNELIDDKHLEWLFNNKVTESIKNTSVLHIAINEKGIPELGVVNNEEIIQPNAYNDLQMLYMFYLDHKKLDDFKSFDEKILVLLESILLSLGKNLDTDNYQQQKNPIVKCGDNLECSKYFGEESVICKVYSTVDSTSLETLFWYNINNGFKDDLVIEYDKKNGKFVISSNTDYYNFKIEIVYKDTCYGLSPLNPNEWVNRKGLFNNDKSIKLESNEHKARYTLYYEIIFQGNIKYPETFTEEYYTQLAYLKKLNSRIFETWDIIKFYERYPHHHIMYEINRRIKKIEKSLGVNED